jgi:hypothetical protein
MFADDFLKETTLVGGAVPNLGEGELGLEHG